jgi:hypothetical protein
MNNEGRKIITRAADAKGAAMKTNYKKLVWKVSTKETGRFASFLYRAWPCAYLNKRNGSLVLQVLCKDSYSKWLERNGKHKPLFVKFARFRFLNDDTELGQVTFDWSKQYGPFTNLDTLKYFADEFCKTEGAHLRLDLAIMRDAQEQNT